MLFALRSGSLGVVVCYDLDVPVGDEHSGFHDDLSGHQNDSQRKSSHLQMCGLQRRSCDDPVRVGVFKPFSRTGNLPFNESNNCNSKLTSGNMLSNGKKLPPGKSGAKWNGLWGRA